MYELSKKNSLGRKMRVVIIEDDLSMQNLIRESILAVMKDVEVIRFSDPREAIHELWEKDTSSKSEVDLIFLDVFLGNKSNGLDVLEYCQYIPENITVVLISSHFSEEQIKKINSFNIDPTILKKPFSPIDVMNLTKWSLSYH